MKTSFLAFTLAQQPGLRVRCALMGGIAAPFPMEVNRGVARVSVGCPGRAALLGFEALQAGCRLNQGSIHREVLIRQQALPVRFQHHFSEQSLAHSMPEQPLPVLGEGGGKGRQGPHGVGIFIRRQIGGHKVGEFNKFHIYAPQAF